MQTDGGTMQRRPSHSMLHQACFTGGRLTAKQGQGCSTRLSINTSSRRKPDSAGQAYDRHSRAVRYLQQQALGQVLNLWRTECRLPEEAELTLLQSVPALAQLIQIGRIKPPQQPLSSAWPSIQAAAIEMATLAPIHTHQVSSSDHHASC